MQRQISFAVAACAGTLSALGGPLDPPPGPVGPTYKTLQQVEPRVDASTLPGSASAVIVIDRPGSYFLTGDVQGQNGKNGIEILARDVTLDLNGFSLNGVAGSMNGIEIKASGLKLRNGSISHFGADGVHRLYGRSPATIEDVVATYNGGSGFDCDGVFNRCIATWNDQDGFSASGSVIRDSTALGNLSGYGFVASFGTVMDGCVADLNQVGIRVETGSSVRHSSANSSTSHGFYNSSESIVEDCIARQNQTGFWLEGGTLKNSYAVLNSSMGIGARGNSLVTGNTSESNNPNFWFGGNALYGPIVSGAGDLSTIAGGGNPHANFSR